MGGWCGPLQIGELHQLRDSGLTEASWFVWNVVTVAPFSSKIIRIVSLLCYLDMV